MAAGVEEAKERLIVLSFFHALGTHNANYLSLAKAYVLMLLRVKIFPIIYHANK